MATSEKNSCKKDTKDIVILAYRTGMRIGEILTLRWKDINFDKGFFVVKRTLSSYVDRKAEITEPKTKKSKRKIDLDGLTIRMLSEKHNKKEGYVFCKKDGSMYSRQAIRLPKICKNAGIKPHNFHTLRHAHATILLAAGVHPKIVQERLGHSNISTTLDIYSHLVAGMQQAAVDVFNKIKKKGSNGMIESILLIVFIWAWVKARERSANKYCNQHNTDWGKMNEDRTMNDLSNSQVDRNILSGKYDKR